LTVEINVHSTLAKKRYVTIFNNCFFFSFCLILAVIVTLVFFFYYNWEIRTLSKHAKQIILRKNSIAKGIESKRIKVLVNLENVIIPKFLGEIYFVKMSSLDINH